MATTQHSQRFGWSPDQFIRLSRSLASGYSQGGYGQGSTGQQGTVWTVKQRLQLSAAKADLFI